MSNKDQKSQSVLNRVTCLTVLLIIAILNPPIPPVLKINLFKMPRVSRNSHLAYEIFGQDNYLLSEGIESFFKIYLNRLLRYDGLQM